MKLVLATAVGMATAYITDVTMFYGIYSRAAMEIVQQIMRHFS
jgi:hypothetical protein